MTVVVSDRGLIPRLQQGLPFSLSFHAWIASTRFAASGSQSRPPTLTRRSLVSLRHPQLIGIAPAVWPRGKLLARPNLDTNELPRVAFAFHCSSPPPLAILPFVYAEGPIQIYAAQPGPHRARARTIYTELRENIIKNVHKVCVPFP